nr:uncharacterized protein LOC113813185 [Penaeus vannamei]
MSEPGDRPPAMTEPGEPSASLLPDRAAPTPPTRQARTPEPRARDCPGRVVARDLRPPIPRDAPHVHPDLRRHTLGRHAHARTPPPTTTPIHALHDAVSPTHSGSPHSGTPQPDSAPGSQAGSRRSSLFFGPDSRRGSLTKKALTGLVKDASQGHQRTSRTRRRSGAEGWY